MDQRQPGAVGSSSVEALLAEGHALVADGHPDQGLACFRRAAAGGSVLALFDLATCLLDLGRWAEARAAFAAAATDGLAAALRRRAEEPLPAEATARPTAAPVSVPISVPTPAPAPAPRAEDRLRADAERHPAARAALGRLLHLSGRFDEARRVLERGAALEERDSWLPLGNLLLDVFDDPVAAAAAYRAGIEAGDATCHSALGLLLRDLGDVRGADAEFRRGAGASRPADTAVPLPRAARRTGVLPV